MSKKSQTKQLKVLLAYGELHPSPRFSYVTVHPLADEDGLIKQLGITPNQCVTCDLYWAFKGYVSLVTLMSQANEAPSVRYWEKEADSEVPHRFVVSTRCTPLTTKAVESALLWLSVWFESDAIKTSRHGKKPSIIFDGDIILGRQR